MREDCEATASNKAVAGRLGETSEQLTGVRYSQAGAKRWEGGALEFAGSQWSESRLSTVTRRNKLGQAIRERGATTRQSLLDATRRLLEYKAPLELSVPAITKEAGSSPATFYVYFTDAKDALFALVEGTQDDFVTGVLPSLEGPWAHAEIPERVETFVRAYYGFWDKHRRVLAVRKLEADLGDQRFSDQRLDLALPALRALSDRIMEAGGPNAGITRTEAWGFAVVSCAAMEQMFSYPANAYRADLEFTVDHVVHAQIDVMCRMFGYFAPPPS